MLLVFAILPFFSTLLGGAAALRLRHRLHPFMAFAAGVLVATALADLLPEATDLILTANPAALPFLPGAAAVCGFLAFSALDAFVHRETWEHGHQRLPSPVDPDAPHEHVAAPRSRMSIFGPLSLIAHSTLDGLAIGLAFRANAEVGLLVGVAVLAHDFADGMNVVTLSLSGGERLRPARVLLLVDALAPVVGAAIGSLAQIEPSVLGFLLAAFSGVFIAIGAGHLLPEAHHQRPGASPQLIAIATAGAVLVIGIRWALG
ncbi:MAG TPA: ZIP family metal transporter [Chloroflexota bacterium]|nr:ZIP family metal transporter [Chloroflexota bacterium]